MLPVHVWVVIMFMYIISHRVSPRRVCTEIIQNARLITNQDTGRKTVISA